VNDSGGDASFDVRPSARYDACVTSEQIRKLVRRRPFRQIEILADRGEKLLVRHPEAVLIGRDVVIVLLVIVLLPDGTADYIETRNISRLRVLPRRAVAL